MGYNSPWHDPNWYYMQRMAREEQEYEYEYEYDEPFEEYQEEVRKVENNQPRERSIDEINAELDQIIRDLKRGIKEKEAAIKAEKKRVKQANRKSSARKKKTSPADDAGHQKESVKPVTETSQNPSSLGCIVWMALIALWGLAVFFM